VIDARVNEGIPKPSQFLHVVYMDISPPLQIGLELRRSRISTGFLKSCLRLFAESKRNGKSVTD
jgi:hypothetical protein